MTNMKRYSLILFLTLFLLPSCYQQQQLDYSKWYTVEVDDEDPLPTEDVKGLMIMSSNVRYYSARDKADDPDVGDRDWEVRKKGYFQMVNTMQPMVIGVQEAEMNQANRMITLPIDELTAEELTTIDACDIPDFVPENKTKTRIGFAC